MKYINRAKEKIKGWIAMKNRINMNNKMAAGLNMRD